jgi:hypothetical protein
LHHVNINNIDSVINNGGGGDGGSSKDVGGYIGSELNFNIFSCIYLKLKSV